MMHRLGKTALATTLASCLALGAAEAAFAEETKPSTDEDRASTSKQDSGTQASGSAPVVVLVPVMFAADTNLADGCWARLYDSQDYKGNMLTLVGPVDIPRTRPMSLTGFEFGPNYDSVKVGPKATLRVWDDPGYSDQAATFISGQNVADMESRLGDFEDIESLKISCKS